MDTSATAFMDVVSDERFCRLLRLSQTRALRWDEFLCRQLPSGLSPLETWNALQRIGAAIGIRLFEDADHVPLWYLRTYELEDTIDAIAQRTNEGSELHHIVFGQMDSSFFGELRAREAAAALVLDGFAEDCDTLATQLDDLGCADRNTVRLAGNYLALDANLSRYRDANFSEDLFEVLFAQLVDGVELPAPSALYDAPFRRALTASKRAYLQRLIAYENDRAIREDTGVLKGVLIGREIKRFELFGQASNLMASILARQFYLHRRMPLLAIAPLSELYLNWTRGNMANGSSLPTPATVEETYRHAPGNVTLKQTVSAHWIALAVDEIERTAHDSLRLTEFVRDGLMADRRFNSRQRLVLARALRSPQAEFHTRYHQLKHAISYATARRDLVKLADEGFLARKRHGKDTVFFPGKRLQELVADYNVPRAAGNADAIR